MLWGDREDIAAESCIPAGVITVFRGDELQDVEGVTLWWLWPCFLVVVDLLRPTTPAVLAPPRFTTKRRVAFRLPDAAFDKTDDAIVAIRCFVYEQLNIFSGKFKV